MLKNAYDTADQIPESLREHYIEHNGKFILQVEGHREQIARLNGEAKGHRERAEAAEARLGELANAGEELKLARAHERNAIVETRLGLALARARATPDGADLLRELLSRRIDIATEHGKRVVRVLDSTGKPQAGATIDSMVAEAREKFPGAFHSLAGHGGGASPRTGAQGNRMSRRDFDALTPVGRAVKMASGTQLVD